MGKPWEKYSEEQPSSKAPWEKYSEDVPEKVVDERHPGISVKDRALFKNLAVDPAQGMQFLQEKYPDLTFKTGSGGEVLVRGQDETQWKKLDPTGFDIEDISDIAFDVPAALLEGGATALGGLGGAMASLPLGGIGAIPGAMAAGGAAGAGVETARQGLGKYFGVAEEFDPEQIKTAGMFGAASPLLLGSGAAVKQVGRYAAKKGLEKEAAEKILQQQSGLIGRGYAGAKKAIAPRVGQLVSGIDKETLKWTAQNLDKINAAEDAYGQVAIYGELADNIQAGHLAKKQAASDAYGETLDQLDVVVDVSSAEKPLNDLLARYEVKAMEAIEKFGDDAPNKVDFQNYVYLQGKIGEYSQGSGMLQGKRAQEYLNTMNDLTGVRRSTTPGKLEVVDRELQNAAKQVTKNVDDVISKQGSGAAFKAAKGEYKKALSREKDVNKYFKDEETTERTLNNLLSPKKSARRKKVMQLADDVGAPIDESARESIATSLFSRPSEDVLSLGGTTSTSRSIPLGAAGAGLGYYFSSQLGDGHGTGVAGALLGGALGRRLGSPATLRRAMELNQSLNKLGGGIQNIGPGALPAVPQSAVQLWQNLEQNRR